METERKILDPGLPHGRLWVMERGCECPECLESRRRRAFNAHAETRDLEGQLMSRKRREANARWAQPRWTKYQRRWVITEPPDAGFEPRHTVNVRNHTTGKTREVHLASLAGEKEVEPDVFLRVWYPAA